jgi:hypothetical protein
VVGHDVEPVEPERRHPGQHPALVGHRRRVDHVVGRHPVGGDEQQVVVVDLVEVADLAGAQVGQATDGHGGPLTGRRVGEPTCLATPPPPARARPRGVDVAWARPATATSTTVEVGEQVAGAPVAGDRRAAAGAEDGAGERHRVARAVVVAGPGRLDVAPATAVATTAGPPPGRPSGSSASSTTATSARRGLRAAPARPRSEVDCPPAWRGLTTTSTGPARGRGRDRVGVVTDHDVHPRRPRRRRHP